MAKENCPNLFIVGAPKCGTTAVADYLSTHPDIFLGNVKEPNYWSFDMPFYAKREGFTSEKKYLDMYRNAPNRAEYLIDASTHYLYSEVAIENIEKRFSGSKYIVCIRRQEDLAAAWHMQMYNAGYETIADFEDAWFKRIGRREGECVPVQCPEPRLLDYESVASVGGQIERMFSVVEASRVHIVCLSEVKDDVSSVYEECLSFLGLPSDGRNVFPVANSSFVNRSTGLSHMVRKPFFRRVMHTLTNFLGPSISIKLKSGLKNMLYKKADRKPLSLDFQEELKQAFKEDAVLVHRLTGKLL